MKKGFVSLLSCCWLTACATGSSEMFDCEAGKGVGCKSITQVNALVDQGSLESGGQVQPMPPVVGPLQAEAKKIQEIVLSDNSVIHRASEEHLRIWMGPFQDDRGNFHEPSVIHTVIRPSYWQMQTIQWS